MKYAYIHKDGCKNPAFYLTDIPVAGDLVTADIFRNLDGTIPVLGTPMICGSCKDNILYFRIDSVEQVP